MKEGFYTKIENELVYAPENVYTPTTSILKSERMNYSYPIEGWTWFDSLEDACVFFEIDIERYSLPIENF